MLRRHALDRGGIGERLSRSAESPADRRIASEKNAGAQLWRLDPVYSLLSAPGIYF